MIKLSILGAGGRMGRSVIRALADDDRLRLHGALGRSGSAHIGQDAGLLAGLAAMGVAVSDELAAVLAGADVAIDFTLPDATLPNVEGCEAAGCALVIGSTGHDDAQQARLRGHRWKIPVVLAPNMSPGVNLLYRLASIAATALPDFDAEICEVHHKHKKDAPSGTALRLAEALAEGGRAKGEIGISAMRAGEIVGEHTLLLAGRGERLELRHVAQDRSCFAVGALRAAAWVHGKQPGLYDMEAVLGLPGPVQ